MISRNKIKDIIWKVIIWFWPPSEFIYQKIKYGEIKPNNEVDYESLKTLIATDENGTNEVALKLSELVYKSEVSRKDTIESKAQSFLFTLSVSATIIIAIPFLFSNRWGLPIYTALISTAIFTASILYLIFSGLYGLKARQLGEVAIPGADLFLEYAKDNKITSIDQAVTLIEYAKYNEPALLKKSNFLATAEQLFIRGIACLAIAAIFSITVKMVVELTNSNLTGGNHQIEKQFDEIEKIILSKETYLDELQQNNADIIIKIKRSESELLKIQTKYLKKSKEVLEVKKKLLTEEAKFKAINTRTKALQNSLKKSP